jgi:hypothetical protein
VHLHHHHVALSRVDGWPGELPVHRQDALLAAQPRDVNLPDLLVINSLIN